MEKEYELVEFQTETGETIQVEVVSSQSHDSGYVKAGAEQTQENIPSKATKTLEKTLCLIAPVANGVLSAVQQMKEKPSEFTASFKAALSGKFDFKLVTLASDANLEIKLTWKA